MSRFFPPTTPAPSMVSTDASGPQVWADNHRHPVHALVRNVLQEDACLIVTGYQDFLSSLAYLIGNVNNLGDRPAGSIRMVFGTNTDSSRTLGPMSSIRLGSRPSSRSATRARRTSRYRITWASRQLKRCSMRNLNGPSTASGLAPRPSSTSAARRLRGNPQVFLIGSAPRSSGARSRKQWTVGGMWQSGAECDYSPRQSGKPMSTPCQRAYVIFRWAAIVNAGQCQPVSGYKIREIKGLSDKPLVSLSYWNRWRMGS